MAYAISYSICRNVVYKKKIHNSQEQRTKKIAFNAIEFIYLIASVRYPKVMKEREKKNTDKRRND